MIVATAHDPFLCACPSCGTVHRAAQVSIYGHFAGGPRRDLDAFMAKFHDKMVRVWTPHFPLEAQAPMRPPRRPVPAPPRRPAWSASLRAFR